MEISFFVVECGTNQATLGKGSPLRETQDSIIVPFICLVNSWIKGDEAEREWDNEC